MYVKQLTKKFLKKEYIINRKSICKIVEEIKCSTSTLYRYLKLYNIKIRTKSKAQEGKFNHRFINGKTLEKYHCIDCGKKIPYQTGYYGQGRCDKCKYAIPENHPNWQGGKSFEEYGKEFDNALKEQIRFRDKYKCRICGCSQLENGRQLDCHHIDYDKKNNNINNLIVLCRSCHLKINGNRDYWFAYFTYIRESFRCI